MMRELRWVRGKSAAELATAWGLATATVEGMAAEASRRVRAEVTDPDVVTETVACALDKVLRGALDRKKPDRRSAIMAADVWSRIVGARAPEKHLVAQAQITVEQFEAFRSAMVG